jgi:hypothetical protein
MGTKLAELYVEIKGDKRESDRTIDAVRSDLRSLVGFAGKEGQNLAHALFGPARAAAHALGSAIGASLAIGMPSAVGGIAYAVKQASDLNEQISKTKYTFGDAAGTILGASEKMADAFGVPKREFIEAASGIGLIGKAAGMTQAEASKLGADFSKLATDAASFYNIPLEEALIKIRAGLVGESEPLRTLGVLLNEDAVKAEALRLKLTGANKELTEGQKVQARASLITRGLADASGDLTRTQDALANRVREVWGRLQNLAATLGEQLMPAARAVVQVIKELGEGLAARLERSKDVIRGWAGGFKDALQYVRALIRDGDTLKGLFQSFMTNWKGMLGELFATLRDNFAELGRYFGDVIAESITKGIDRAMPRPGAWGRRQVGAETPEDHVRRVFGDRVIEEDPLWKARHGRPDVEPPKFRQPNIGQFFPGFDKLKQGKAALDIQDSLKAAAERLRGLATGAEDLKLRLGRVQIQGNVSQLKAALTKAVDKLNNSGFAKGLAAGQAMREHVKRMQDAIDKQFHDNIRRVIDPNKPRLRPAPVNPQQVMAGSAGALGMIGGAMAGGGPAGALLGLLGGNLAAQQMQKEPKRGEHMDVMEWTRKIQEGAFGGDVQKKQLTKLEEIAALLAQGKRGAAADVAIGNTDWLTGAPF